MPWGTTARTAACIALVATTMAATTSSEPLPSQLAGTWRITRVLPTKNTACWSDEQARPLVGSTLTYRANAMRWRGGQVPLEDINTRQVTDREFRKENAGADFEQLGIHSPKVLEVDLQHEDADITGASTEVPGDSVLLAGPGRIVVSACGVYFEAMRGGAGRGAARK
ncbi:hypothetical protein [Granulicella mallensis]|uniref:Lipocalin-like domain-containing protein n=1 Tax=Granulicella mallensis TaxID=940614 RepID=A0A7W7ZSK3_9BACT|nr:hypothetical protein [Granulicella mallensis]MBB5065023.1 hypothetical protein [Granulicella mallensis]